MKTGFYGKAGVILSKTMTCEQDLGLDQVIETQKSIFFLTIEQYQKIKK